MSTDAAGSNAQYVTLVPNASGVVTFTPLPDHPWVDVVPIQRGANGSPYASEFNTRIQTSPPPANGNTIIGTNDAGGWSPSAAAVIVGGHITWGRAEARQESIPTDVSYGFRMLQVVGNPADTQRLNGVSSSTYGSSVVADASPSATLLEAGNEMYYKGGVCDPASYGRLTWPGSTRYVLQA